MSDPLRSFQASLAELYEQVNKPSYRMLSTFANREGLKLASATVGTLLKGDEHPKWATVQAFVESCRCYARGHRPPLNLPSDVFDLSVWRERYLGLEGAVRSGSNDKTGSRHVSYSRDSSYVIHDFLFPRHPRPAELPPSRLLSAQNQVVGFRLTGRDDDLTKLTDWRDEKARATVLLMHGQGGQGKTRLAAHFVELSKAAGWFVTQARHRGEARGAERYVEPSESIRDLLVVVDYADRWPAHDLLTLMDDHFLGRATGRVRVLLLARDHRWWSSIRHDLPDGFDAAKAVELGALTSPGDERRLEFQRARDRFAHVLGVDDVLGIHSSVDLDAKEFGLVLNVHMAALVAVDAAAHPEQGISPPDDPGRLSAYLLDRERAHWRKMLLNRQINITPEAMQRAVFIGTLVGGADYQEAQGLLDQVGVTTPMDPAQRVLDGHSACYPSSNSATVLEPLYPDRLAEDYLALQIPGHTNADYEADPWTLGAVSQLLTSAGAAQPRYALRALTMLVETARRWGHVRGRLLYPLLRKDPRLILVAGNNALTAFTELSDVDVDVLIAVEPHLPNHRHVDLDHGIAMLTRRLTHHRLPATTDHAERANLWLNLGWRLSNAGLVTESAEATQNAIAAIREWGRANGVIDEPEILAAALTNYAMSSAKLGHHDMAIRTAREAVATYRRLAASETAYCPGLATALTNLGGILSTIKAPEAKAATEEAVQLYERLTNTGSSECVPGLAAAHDNLGNILSKLDRPDEALRETLKAVSLFETLAAHDNAAFDPDLAAALDNLSGIQSRLGQLDDSLRTSRRAVGILERLASRNPEAHEADYAGALINLGGILSSAKQHLEALEYTRAGLEIYRRLAQAHPAMFALDLVRGLRGFAWVRAVADRELRDALAAAEQLTEIYKRMSEADPAAFRMPRRDANRIVRHIRAQLSRGHHHGAGSA